MNDLESQWDDFPTATPPVDDVLRSGRTAARRRARRPRVLAAATAVVATFAAGVAVGGLTTDTPPGVGDARPVAFQADLEPARSCDDLLRSYRERALELVTDHGWGLSDGYAASLDAAREGLTTLRAERTVDQVSGSATGTTVQEAAVDEPDTVKTDGRLLVRLDDDVLEVHDVSGSSVVERSTVQIPRLAGGELLLVGATVVVVGGDTGTAPDPLTGDRLGSRVVTVSIADPGAPAITSTVTYASRVLAARQHGTVVRLVLAAGLPDLDFVGVDDDTTPAEARQANRAVVERSTIDDWLPTFDPGTGDRRLLDCTDVAVPPDSPGLDTVSVVGLSVDDPTEPRAIGLAAATTIAYASTDHLFLADAPATGCVACLGATVDLVAPSTRPAVTHLYDFALRGVDATHVASGTVDGTIADRWSIDEADGVLRVAVATGRSASVVTLKRDGTELVEVGRVDGLGPDEEIKGVRWFDDLAVVVTFREVDPLYTVDLGDPRRPRLLGELKIPGYSDYLHPIGKDLLLGIGYTGGDAQDAQVAIFDVADRADVRRVDVVDLPDTQVLATVDPRAFTWLPGRETALVVVRSGRDVGVERIRVDGGRLTTRRVADDLGSDEQRVRTIALPRDRVVLVGDDVRLLDLG